MNYAVLGCDRNEEYSFLLPIVCLFWRRKGYRPLVLLVGESAEWLGDVGHRLEVERAREIGAEIYWLGNFKDVRTSTVAQCSRIFAAAMTGVEAGDLLVTSDVDMLPIGSWVGGGIDATKDLHLFYANAYDGSDYVHYPMCYVIAKAKVWKEIVGSSSLETMLAEAPVDENGSWNWDERWLGGAIEAWREKVGRDRVQEISRTFVEGEWRIDRSDWDGAMAETKGSLRGVADAHVIRPAHTIENWPRLRPLLALVLSDSDLAWVDDYHRKWSQA